MIHKIFFNFLGTVKCTSNITSIYFKLWYLALFRFVHSYFSMSRSTTDLCSRVEDFREEIQEKAVKYVWVLISINSKHWHSSHVNTWINEFLHTSKIKPTKTIQPKSWVVYLMTRSVKYSLMFLLRFSGTNKYQRLIWRS